MKLAIISHTPHYKKNGVVVGWGPTVREINHLTNLFDEIYHIAPLHKEEAPASSLPYESDGINFIPLKPYGGVKFSDKISILTTSLNNLGIIKKILDKVDWVQFRAPTSMGLYVLPYLSLRNTPKRWVKYAGNWNMNNPPLSYKFQKWWLQNNFQKSKVTINGYWEDQRSHILNFQNPCLDNEELERARKIAQEKKFDAKLVLCFAGSLTENKGVDLILDSLNKVKQKSEIKEIIFAGDGINRKKYEELASKINMRIIFKGFINRKELESIYKDSHIIMLPSESEGFPKVIAEAAAYGCVPIVSDVSSISQYFNDSNGFLLKKITSDELAEKIDLAMSDRLKLKILSDQCVKAAELFTFEHYMNRLEEKILFSGQIHCRPK
ncbi:MAG: glycosyltransferase family 4 protein [Bacteroidota bacterium]|nr:glycosyltransferase family 4 protein [Bacteroidota bacterium]